MPKAKPTNPFVKALILRVVEGKRYEVLMIQKKYKPFKGKFAFPGGYVEPNEDPGLSL